MTTIALPRLALIGYGAIGAEIEACLKRLGETDRLVAVLVRPGRSAPAAVHDVEALIAARPEVVIECAGHEAALAYCRPLLRAGIDVLLSSIGILSDDAVLADLTQAEAEGGGRLLLGAGAVAGLDGLTAAALAGVDAVTYLSYKPPHAWRGTQAEQTIDLDHEVEEVVFFQGSARHAARDYPKNANVAIAVALSALGPERTQVKLVSSRKVTDPLGVIEAEGAFGRFRFEVLALAAPSNPKTSALTAYSLLQCVRLDAGLPVLLLPGVKTIAMFTHADRFAETRT